MFEEFLLFTVQPTCFYLGLIIRANLAGILATKSCPKHGASEAWTGSTFPGAIGNFSDQEVIEAREFRSRYQQKNIKHRVQGASSKPKTVSDVRIQEPG